MKALSTLIAVCCTILAHTQVLNGGFEFWTGNVPDDWSNNNIAPLSAFPITPSSDSHTGAFAALGEIIANPIDGSPFAPVLQNIGGAPVSQHPTAVTGWYKFSPASTSTVFSVSATTVDANGTPNGGFGVVTFNTLQSTYDMFSVPISGTTGNSTAAVTISIGMTDTNNDTSSIGSTFLVDDIGIDLAQGVSPLEALGQDLSIEGPHPNIFSERTCITMVGQYPTSLQVDITNTSGQLVYSEMTRQNATNFCWEPQDNVDNGLYFIRVSGMGQMVSKKALLQR